MSKKRKIAVFDSGLGGISVLKELKKQLPGEDFLYYGDSANAPYGVRTEENIQKLCDDVIQKITETEKNVKCVVIACNTATSAALGHLQKNFPEIHFIGIEPAIGWAADELENPRILTFATDFTVNGKLFRDKVAELSDKASFISKGAPQFVRFVEDGVSDATDSKECRKYIDSLCEDIDGGVDAIVLGCTHFPFIKEMIREEVSGKLNCSPKLYDAAVLVAKNTRKWLSEHGLLSEETSGSIEIKNSDPSKIEAMWKLYES